MDRDSKTWRRRQFLTRLAAFPPVIAAARSASGGQAAGLKGTDTDPSALDAMVTANDRFFIRNHFPPPVLRVDDWKLSIQGHLRNRREIAYSEIRQMSSRQLTVTVECAGNGVGGGAVGTATWTGVCLRDLLAAAQFDPGVRCVRLVGADSGRIEASTPRIPYARSIPLEKALDPNTLVAFEMNGAPLSPHHGFPVRVIVPGWYGMDSVKWLVGIEALDREDLSHFMAESYVSSRLLAVGTERHCLGEIRVKSQITKPLEGERLPRQATAIRGLAWAGESQVRSVEVSWDGGKSWMPAELEGQAQPYAWVAWKRLWTPPASGLYTISARAIDNHGRVQPAAKDPLRFDQYENNWYQVVHCEVL